jgi:hypothetical protein
MVSFLAAYCDFDSNTLLTFILTPFGDSGAVEGHDGPAGDLRLRDVAYGVVDHLRENNFRFFFVDAHFQGHGLVVGTVDGRGVSRSPGLRLGMSSSAREAPA